MSTAASPRKKRGATSAISPERSPGKNRPSQPASLQPEGETSTDGGESANIFDRVWDDSFVSLHRRDPLTGWVMHPRLALEEATEEFVQEKFGGGVWRFQEKYRDPETNALRIGRTRQLVIGGPYKGIMETPPIVGTISPASSPSNGPATAPGQPGGFPNFGEVMSGGLLQMFQASGVMQQQMMAFMQSASEQNRALLTAVAGSRTDFMPLISAILPIVQTLLTRNGNAMDPLEMVTKVAGVLGTVGGGKGTDVSGMIGMMRDLLDLKDELGGARGADAPDPLLGSVPKLVELLVERHNMEKGGRPALLPATTPLTEPLPNVPTPTPLLLWQRVINENKRTLISFAASGQPADFVAEMAIRLMPDNYEVALKEFVNMPDHVQQALDFAPELKNFPDWTTTFFAEVKKMLLEDEAEDVADGPE